MPKNSDLEKWRRWQTLDAATGQIGCHSSSGADSHGQQRLGCKIWTRLSRLGSVMA
jgi:hypothetical protein